MGDTDRLGSGARVDRRAGFCGRRDTPPGGRGYRGAGDRGAAHRG